MVLVTKPRLDLLPIKSGFCKAKDLSLLSVHLVAISLLYFRLFAQSQQEQFLKRDVSFRYPVFKDQLERDLLFQN